MLSRRLTVTISLLLVSLAGCENQGKGAGTDAIDVICGYQREAIERLGCMDATGQCKEPVSAQETFVNTCLSNQRIVQGRCASAQRAVADCLSLLLEDQADRQTAFARTFECTMAQPTWRAPTAELKYNEYIFLNECPGSINTAAGTPELCAKLDAENATNVIDPTLGECLLRWGMVDGVETEIGVQDGSVRVQVVDTTASPTVPLFCKNEIAALSDCSVTPPSGAP